MKRPSWKLVTAGLLVFLYTLVMHAPLAVIYAYLKPAEARVGLQGIDGDLQNGGAAGLLFDNQTVLRDLHWTQQPWLLLIGRAAWDIEGGADGLQLGGRVAQTLGGSTRLSDLRISGSIKPLLSAFKLYLPIEGQLGLDLQSLVLRQQWPSTAQGRLEIDGLGWKLGRDPVVIGDFSADIKPGDDGIDAVIRSLRGALEVSGQAQIHADRRYELNLQVHAKSDAPPTLVNLLAGLGAPDNLGNYHIRRSGQLPGGPAVSAAAPAAAPAAE